MKCRHTANSQKGINLHFKNAHGRLACDTCGKVCNTISALRKHSYEHMDKVKRKPCADCEKSFAFESQLKAHRKVHLNALEHHCIHCTKSFKNKGELVKHLNVHSRKKWKCQTPGCEYSCSDPRNLRVHMYSHKPAGWYKCENCGKLFKFYMQMKRHRTVDCTSLQL